MVEVIHVPERPVTGRAKAENSVEGYLIRLADAKQVFIPKNCIGSVDLVGCKEE